MKPDTISNVFQAVAVLLLSWFALTVNNLQQSVAELRVTVANLQQQIAQNSANAKEERAEILSRLARVRQ